jgi:STE24 endopeptidase
MTIQNLSQDEDFREKARAYTRIKNKMIFIEFFLIVIYLLVILLSGFSLNIEVSIKRYLSANPYLLLMFYLFFIGIIFSFLTFWLDYYDDFYLERKFDLSTQNFKSWLKEKFKKDILSFIFSLLMLELIYVFLRKSENFWWLWAFVLWVFVTIILSHILPTLIIPIFFKQEPIENDELKEKLILLLKKTGTKLNDFRKVNLSKGTKKANAALVGWGKTKRIILSDTLLKDYTINEITSVVAHEIGHFQLRHFWKLFSFGSLVSLGGFYLTYLILNSTLSIFGFKYAYNIAAFPLLALTLTGYTIVVKPIQNFFSRALEREADIYALKYTENPLYFKEALLKLKHQNLANANPSKAVEIFLYDHPPISKRIKLIEEFRP